MTARKPRVVWVVEWRDRGRTQWLPRSPLYETQNDSRRAARDLRIQFGRSILYRVAKYVRSEQ